MSAEFGPAPPLKHLTSEVDRSLIVRLRESVAPILANNILPHFTDHSVIHSDHVTQLVDKLAEPLQSTSEALRAQELIILYSACYLHDIGLQLQNAGKTQVIQSLELTPPWDDLDEDTRRTLLRTFHHRISGEMVLASVRAMTPIIGIQLTDAYEPSRVACLCEAHNLFLEISADRNRYDQLTSDGPNIRMALISGLLRTADILDESRRRAVRNKARTLNLSVESQSHWWRHYYTENVTFDQNERVISIWFDFPPDRFPEYSKVISALQLPWIQTELQRHLPVFNKYGVNWSLDTRFTSKQYSDTEIMPDEVMAHMLGQLLKQHSKEDEARREIVLNAFNESRPHIHRRLEAIREQKDKIPPVEYLLETSKIAEELWNIGSRRSAVFALVFEYERSSQHLTDSQRIDIGTRLLEMVLADGTLELAQGWILRLCDDASELSADDPRAFRSLSLIAEWFAKRCAYDKAVETINHAIASVKNEDATTELRATLKELHFLQGNLRLIESTES